MSSGIRFLEFGMLISQGKDQLFLQEPWIHQPILRKKWEKVVGAYIYPGPTSGQFTDLQKNIKKSSKAKMSPSKSQIPGTEKNIGMKLHFIPKPGSCFLFAWIEEVVGWEVSVRWELEERAPMLWIQVELNECDNHDCVQWQYGTEFVCMYSDIGNRYLRPWIYISFCSQENIWRMPTSNVKEWPVYFSALRKHIKHPRGRIPTRVFGMYHKINVIGACMSPFWYQPM